MKDTVIKETGNSRFLRSSVAEDITFGEFIALLRAGQLPIDLAGINEGGVDVLGTALNKTNLLRDETEAFVFGNAADRTIDETFLRLAPWTLIDTLDGSIGYSGEWVAPDLFGDGSPYDLGVYMIGGGESGEAFVQQLKLSYGGSSYNHTAFGGASGYGKNVIFDNVTPGTIYPFVIGAGGPGKTVSVSTNKQQNSVCTAGGTTSFGGITVPGGGSIISHEGGQSYCYSAENSTRHYFGGVDCPYTDITSHGSTSQNAFDPLMISLARGLNSYGYMYVDDDGTKYTKKLAESGYWGNPTIGALGTTESRVAINTSNVTATGTSGTHGNGGGSAIALQGGATDKTVKATCGSGGDGVIFIYARKAVS